jgi:hypothetical protein
MVCKRNAGLVAEPRQAIVPASSLKELLVVAPDRGSV